MQDKVAIPVCQRPAISIEEPVRPIRARIDRKVQGGHVGGVLPWGRLRSAGSADLIGLCTVGELIRVLGQSIQSGSFNLDRVIDIRAGERVSTADLRIGFRSQIRDVKINARELLTVLFCPS